MTSKKSKGDEQELGAEFIAHGVHFGEGVLVARAIGGGDAGVEAGEGVGGTVEFGEELGGHLVGGDVVGGVGDEGVELDEGGVGVGLGELHGEAVAGEGVGGVEVEDFSELGDLVHAAMIAGRR
jgi:hypothetical protein